MEFGILGPLEVKRGDQALALGGAKQRALLAVLLLQANKAIGAERLAELLWREEPPSSAAHAVEVYVSQLRRILEPDGAPYRLLLTGPAGYTLRIDSSSLDAVRFQALVESAAQLPPEMMLKQLQKALGMWRGPALADFPTEPFALGEAARLNDLRLHATEQRIEAELALGRHAALIGELAALTREHPLRESLCGQMMLAFYRSGRQAEASDVYQRTRQRLVDELGMEPGPELQALLKRILQQDRSLSLGGETHPRTNLPAHLTSFVGREGNLVDVRQMLGVGRLVTLVGVGGCGKTRLAVQTVDGLADRFPDGAWFVDLAPLTDSEMVPQAIAASLGVREQPGRPILDTVAEHLRKKSALLLLDNCEHLVDGVAEVTAALLSTCRDIRVLATSRERLRVDGEHVYQVQPLAIPPSGAYIMASELSRFDSSVLFIQRAQQSRPSFSVSDANAPDIADLCRRLDGIPLAIELAAAQIYGLTPREIVTNMGDRFAILASGDRARHPKQRTLWATLQWSHDLIDASEKAVFRRLSVFSGGFDLAAARAVAGDETITPRHVTTLVATLTDKSLVVADNEVSRATRYRLLETVREFATAMLDASGEADAVRDRHAVHYLAFVRDRQPLRYSDVRQWLPEFVYEEDNLRAVLAWLNSRRPGDGLQLATLLTEFWLAAGRLKEGRSWLETMLGSKQVSDKVLLSAAGYKAGSLAYWDGDYVAASTLLAESMELKRELGDTLGAAQQLGLVAAVTQARGDGARAIQLAEEFQTIAHQSGDASIQNWAALYLGWIVYFNGDYSRAKHLFLETLDPFRAERDYSGLALALCGPLVIEAEQGEFESARRWAREVIGLVRDHRAYFEPTGHMGPLVLLAGAEGRDDAVGHLWGGVLRMEREGRLIDATLRRKVQLSVDRVRERLGDERFDILVEEGAAMSDEALRAEALREPERSTP
jgi:predicted ATPase/DNA-binding SARP family transcriptional activator